MSAQSTATVEGLMELVRKYIAEGRKLDYDARVLETLRLAFRDYAERLAAAPAPAPVVAAPPVQAGGDGAGVQIYVASRASLPERPAMWRKLRSEGWPINSTWIDEAGPGETADMGELWRRIEQEVRAAAGVILYAELDDFPLKGAYIEVGMALGMGKRVAVVTPDLTYGDRSYRPVGSWVNHPAVKLCESLDDARAWVSLSGASTPAPAAPAGPQEEVRLPPSAMDWLTSTDPHRTASQEWRDGWDACRNYVTAAIAAWNMRTTTPDQQAPAASAEPVAWVAADTLNSPHPTCVSSLAYMSQFDRDRGREYVPLYAAPVAAQAPRPCTCHPDDRPDGPCREKYAASECQASAADGDALEDYKKNGAMAVRFAPSSAHWSNELRRLFGPDARDGIDRLEERLRAAEQDAARYRWLRKGTSDEVAVVRGLGAMDYGMSAVAYTHSEEIDGDDLDSAIDAALSGEEK